MPVLSGAVAYRQDRIASYWDDINSWTQKRRYQQLVGCPKGCDIKYRLIVETDASDKQVAEYIASIHKQLQSTTCPNHPARIRVNRPQPIS